MSESDDPITRAYMALAAITKRHQTNGTTTFYWGVEVENDIKLLQQAIQDKQALICANDLVKAMDSAKLNRPTGIAIGQILGQQGLCLKRSTRRYKYGLLYELPTTPITEQRLRQVFPGYEVSTQSSTQSPAQSSTQSPAQSITQSPAQGSTPK